mmetsp:Transcript_44983/g.104047  ORF Transcript_44983/g.104047 Transcript_44983/m.104047 type:complete len:273 (+) Transcript_44983:529-1347(+)
MLPLGSSRIFLRPAGPGPVLTRTLTLSSSSSSSMGPASSSCTRMLPGKSSTNADTSGISDKEFDTSQAPGGMSENAPVSPSFTSASASKIHGESCPSASGDAMPELTTEAIEEAVILDLAAVKSGVSTPKPGVPEGLTCGSSFPLNFILSPCSSMQSRWSWIISSTHRAVGGFAHLALLHLEVSILEERAAWALFPSGPASSELFRGDGCGDTNGVIGCRGCLVCCIALIFSSCLIRHELRPHRAHCSSITRVAIVTGTSGQGAFSGRLPAA